MFRKTRELPMTYTNIMEKLSIGGVKFYKDGVIQVVMFACVIYC